MSLPESIDAKRLRQLIELARLEDLGERGDITSKIAELPERSCAEIVAREPCVVAGMAIVPEILSAYDDGLSLREGARSDGTVLDEGGAVLGRVEGPTESLLACERVLLNFLQRLCGVATTARSYVEAVAGTAARIYDTRKTIPGWRALDKYAVRCGGGRNHRSGLYDAILIKDNHLAGVEVERLAGTVFEMLNRAAELSPRPSFVEVEADTPGQLAELFKVVGIDVILVDNFSRVQMGEAVRLRDELGLRGKVALEASGGIDLGSVRAIAETGVDRISVGALTHSVRAADIALERVG
jgi:nicotinate-nucleotide pyrophosphorylase (carboxylating)